MAQISCYGSDLYERILSDDRQTVIGKRLIQKNAPKCLTGAAREAYYAPRQAAAEAELKERLEANIVMVTDLAKEKQQYIIDEIKRMTARVNENSITAKGIQIFKDGMVRELAELTSLNLRLKGICEKLGVPVVQFTAPTVPTFAGESPEVETTETQLYYDTEGDLVSIETVNPAAIRQDEPFETASTIVETTEILEERKYLDAPAPIIETPTIIESEKYIEPEGISLAMLIGGAGILYLLLRG